MTDLYKSLEATFVRNREPRFRAGALIVVGLISAITFGGFVLAQQRRPTTNQKKAATSRSNADRTAKDQNSVIQGPEKKSAKKTLGQVEYPFPQHVKVPTGILDGAAGWLNASGDISFKDLRGKIVLLDFWTYCCINCMHVLPALKTLEKKYPNELVVIGVHSAKFDNEKDSENIRRAVMRYEIEHPVVNDSEMLIWRRFGARAWPTLFMVDAEGRACFTMSGEVPPQVLDYLTEKIDALIKYHKSRGTLDTTPVRFDLESAKLGPMPLRFPTKLLADEKSQRLFISDCNHNRIVVSTLDGNLLNVIGSGVTGTKDGGYAEAEFNHPQGITLVGQMLYVADTENHLIRKVDLAKKVVSTLAGTGTQAHQRVPGGKPRQTALNSPWALDHLDGVLYIAMAGPHQIWSHELGSQTIQVYAGSGREDIIDGPLLESALAQPSGIVNDGKFLYFVDSEGSSIRRMSTGDAGEVTTIVGTADLPSGRLFEFGDVDGIGGQARLQHPLGIASYNGALFVADSYNHKIKKIVETDEGWKVTSLLGTGKRGDKLDPPQFSEPEGLSAAGGKLFIADTNNHRICVADLVTGQVAELKIDDLKPPARPKPKQTDVADTNKPEAVPQQSIASADSLDFEVGLKLPEGFKLNKLAPVTYRLEAVGEQTLIAAEQLGSRRKATADGLTARLKIPLAQKTGKATLKLALSFVYCRDGVGGLCKLNTARWQVPVNVSVEGKQRTIKLTADATK